MCDIMELTESERAELLEELDEEKKLFQFTALLTDDGFETECGHYRYGELLAEFADVDPYAYVQTYYAMSDAYYEERLEDYIEAERQEEEILFSLPLYRNMTGRRGELPDTEGRIPMPT